jgi:hypothetical protein
MADPELVEQFRRIERVGIGSRKWRGELVAVRGCIALSPASSSDWPGELARMGSGSTGSGGSAS